MFEREIKFIYDFNLNKISRLGPYFTYEQLASTDIHPAILHYISSEIDYLVFEDRQNLLKNSVFDYSGEKISYHFTQITEELKKSKRFAAEYIAKLILHASSFTINFLIRPKWALTRFVFDEEKHKTSNEIKQILNYVYYYKYLTKILISYINTKKILSMNIAEFKDLLNKADLIGVDNYLPAILTNSLKSMAEFFNIGEVKKNRIPLPAVEMFLEEKDLLNHLKVLNETFGTDENTRFNLSDYHKVLSRVMLEKEEPQSITEPVEDFETSVIEAPVHIDKSILREEKEDLGVEEESIEVQKSEEATILEDLVEDEQTKEEISHEQEVGLEEKIPSEIEETIELEPSSEEQVSNEEDDHVLTFNGFDGGNILEETENVATESIDEDKKDGAKFNLEPIDPEDESLFSNLFSHVGEESENDKKETGVTGTTEEIALPDDDVEIKTPKKFRIRIKDNSKIEPLYDDEDSELEEKIDLFKKFAPLSEDMYDIDKTLETNLVENDSERVSFFRKDEIEDEEVKNSNEEQETANEENKINQADEESIVIDFPVKKKAEETELEKTVESLNPAEEESIVISYPLEKKVEETELEKTSEPIHEDDTTQNDFRKLIEEQQNLFSEPELDEGSHEINLVDYESEASQKLDEKIAEEKNNISEESRFDVLKQNFIEGKETPPKVDLAEILERKEMTKIIEVLFDYDIEDFAGILDAISKCQNADDAQLIIDQVSMERHINRNSKELTTFRAIIAEYYEKG